VEDEIKKEFEAIDIRLIEGSGGIFKVTYGEEVLFSKLDRIGTEEERFPEPGEITKLLYLKL